MVPDEEDDKSRDAPQEVATLPSAPCSPAKAERRFLLKLDLYLITWAWCAYLIKVSLTRMH